MSNKIKNIDWRDSGAHLPEFLRDFHHQKDLFKCLVSHFDNSDECPLNFRDAQVFTIDWFLWFLWFMAIHGYKLTKTTAKVEHKDIHESIENSNW